MLHLLEITVRCLTRSHAHYRMSKSYLTILVGIALGLALRIAWTANAVIVLTKCVINVFLGVLFDIIYGPNKWVLQETSNSNLASCNCNYWQYISVVLYGSAHIDKTALRKTTNVLFFRAIGPTNDFDDIYGFFLDSIAGDSLFQPFAYLLNHDGGNSLISKLLDSTLSVKSI